MTKYLIIVSSHESRTIILKIEGACLEVILRATSQINCCRILQKNTKNAQGNTHKHIFEQMLTLE